MMQFILVVLSINHFFIFFLFFSGVANFSQDAVVAESTGAAAPTPESKLIDAFQDLVTQNKPKSEKDAYN